MRRLFEARRLLEETRYLKPQQEQYFSSTKGEQ